nr:hypothetical protein [Tanacetum cinerariifolium]
MFKYKSYEALEDHKNLFDALEKSLERDYSNQLLSDLAAAHQKKRKRCDLPRTPFGSPPPQPPPPPPEGAFGALESSPTVSMMNDDSIPDEQVQLSDDEDTENDHLPNTDTRKDWWKPLLEEERPATPKPAWTIPSSNIGDMTTFMNWYYHKVNKTMLTQEDFEGQAYEVVKYFYPDFVHLHFQMEECHKLVIDQIDWANPRDLEYLRYGNKGSSPALSISKIKAARYLDFGLKLLVSEQIVVRIKAYSRYGYDYLSEIVLQRANFQEHMIAEKDFKNLYPSDFEDLNLLLLQGHLDHLPGSDQLVFLVNNNKQKIIRINEMYKFSNGTLTHILEALDYRVKEFKGMNFS